MKKYRDTDLNCEQEDPAVYVDAEANDEEDGQMFLDGTGTTRKLRRWGQDSHGGNR